MLHEFSCAHGSNRPHSTGSISIRRNGGVRKTKSSNIDCHALFSLAFADIYKFA